MPQILRIYKGGNDNCVSIVLLDIYIYYIYIHVILRNYVYIYNFLDDNG